MAQKLNSDREVALDAFETVAYCRCGLLALPVIFDSSHATLQTIHRELAGGAFVTFIPHSCARSLWRNTGAVVQRCLGRSCAP